jgi:predicted neuraminidase
MRHASLPVTSVLAVLILSLASPSFCFDAVPPQHVGPPLAQHAATNRAFQGISSLAVSPGGRLWVTWYAGKTPGEDHNNYVVLSTSGDNGTTWKEVLVVDPDGEGALRTYDPEVWVDPSGRLWLIWAQAVSHDKHAHTWAVVADDAAAEQPPWRAPRLLAPGVMMCKPTVLRDGTWVFPISDWEGRRLKTPEAATAGFWVSKDQGATFTLRGAALVPVAHRTFDEHMFIERTDGALWMLARTGYGIGESVSNDGGKTWSEAAPSTIMHPPARFFISRLASGNLLLVKHGPVAEKTGRSHLTAFISADDGKTWGGGLLLDERNGVSYPDGQQASDGTITITYDFARTAARHILFAAFREEDVLAGKDVSGAVRLRQLVSEASGGQEKRSRPPEPVPAGDLLKGFVHPPAVFGPGPAYGPDKRNYQGIPTLERAPNGRLWAAWYAGKVWEDQYNYVVTATSGDDGKTWSDLKFVLDPDGDGPLRNSDPCLWLDPTGRLWLFWWLDGGGLTATLSVTCENPGDENPRWTSPKARFPGVMLNKPIVRKNGDWLMPAALWNRDSSARVMISKDQGASFSLLGAANIPPNRRNCDEHMLVERKDGSLLMLVRTAGHGLGRSVSTDGGRTWSEVADYLPDATARFHLRRLASGSLLLVKHGPLDKRIGRSEMTAYLSDDDGETWQGGLLIDERTSVSYPDATQAPDGSIRLIYDWERARDKNILMAAFSEADVRAGAFSAGSRQRVLINFATGVNPRLAAQHAKHAVNPNADGAPLLKSPAGRLTAEGCEDAPFALGAKLFTDRAYDCAEVPDALKGARFLCVPLNGTKTLRCARAGTVYVLTPVPERNTDSVSKELAGQGFQKVLLPEVRLFAPSSTRNFCTLYQKACAEGETVTLGKWGVPLFFNGM